MSTTDRVSRQIDEFAAQFEANNAEYIAAVSASSDEELSRIGPDDGRTVGDVAHHMATVQGGFARLIGSVVAGTPIGAPESIEQANQANAEHERAHAGIGREELLDDLRASGDAFAAQVRALDDEDFGRSVGVLAGNEVTIGQVIEFAVIAHQREHLATIRAALIGSGASDRGVQAGS